MASLATGLFPFGPWQIYGDDAETYELWQDGVWYCRSFGETEWRRVYPDDVPQAVKLLARLEGIPPCVSSE